MPDAAQRVLRLRGQEQVQERWQAKLLQAKPPPTRTTARYFHSQSVERPFPSASTSYSKIAATLFSRDHLGDELW